MLETLITFPRLILWGSKGFWRLETLGLPRAPKPLLLFPHKTLPSPRCTSGIPPSASRSEEKRRRPFSMSEIQLRREMFERVNPGTCARSRAPPPTTCWWRRQLCWQWFAARRRSLLFSGTNIANIANTANIENIANIANISNIANTVNSGKRNNWLNISKVGADRTCCGQSASPVHGSFLIC